MVKLQYDGKERFHITIPQQIVRLKQWQKGQELAFIACEDGSIKLKEMPK